MSNLKHLKRIIGASIIVALASQINIGILNTDFRVSAGIIFFALFLFHYKDMKPIPMSLISGIAVYILRVIVCILGKDDLKDVIFSYQLEILFYTFYGIVYSLLIKKINRDRINKLVFVLIVSDLCANLIEILVRIIVEDAQFNQKIIITLLFVAIVRSSIVWLVLTGLKYYKMLLIKEEHEKRYTKLLWLTAQLKLEMYWMEKNMDNIERIMYNSYELFEKISLRENEDSWANRAVTIAKDVHEIKKEYELAIRGIKELTENKLQDEGMKFKDIIRILDETMKREIRHLDKNIELVFQVEENFYTSKHYYLMSVFRNLIMNAIDSIPESDKVGKINFIHKVQEGQHIFIISDTGCGIDYEDLEHIFSPGFSTKINYNTGQINRGLGLSVVQDIVERHFEGRVTVDSIKDKGTTFHVYIPRNSVEVDSDEHIHC
ncbi:signal transduction histidine kinase [Gottschalkia acidurici 9a]|uniref:histidine kinase n=1 Tax=Gottschalkia acidurici (strain ATCC 7906 / DSM 604 / BCRC 14475 / CIP 104303 / KCTC 5404 / NCIMB 10678 / 9a) TaxID=1128398 RepID=K0AXY7_GOTA9|nr:signal transduction histidine kinase [Gottschalkia acidurici 9a]